MKLSYKQVKKLVDESTFFQYNETDGNGTDRYVTRLAVDVLHTLINKKLKKIAKSKEHND